MRASRLLADLLTVLPDARVSGATDLEICAIGCDSRAVGYGGLFVAIRGGEERDRHEFVGDAVARGASAVVVEQAVSRECKATVIEVDDCRIALPALAARFYAEPAQQLRMFGVTGTNGKTTTALIIHAIIEQESGSCGYLGTLGSMAAEGMRPIANTTPEASELHRELRAMVDAGCTGAVLEVSSHALALGRVNGIEFDVAVFTNMSRDHLDFHRTEEEYFAAKRSLFDQLKKNNEPCAIVNIDDSFGANLSEELKGSALTFGRHGHADVRMISAENLGGKTVLTLDTPHGQICIQTMLTGSFNCSNVMGAVACALVCGVKIDTIREALARFEGVPGRFERIDAGQAFEVIVDYAHTPAGLETVLKTARELTDKRLICLFGCGGDRDAGKRSQMGRIASELADVVVLTSDNPRSEQPECIIDQIKAGISDTSSALVCPDRREAIGRAFQFATAGDVVVLAGKGNENYQIFADRIEDFDDRLVAREWVECRARVSGSK